MDLGRTARLLLGAAALTACHSSPPESRAATQADATDAAAIRSAQAPALPGVVADAGRGGPIGLSDLAPPSPAATRHNDAGVALLEKGKLDEAKTELTAALAETPSFTLARYNLACAHARGGDMARAARELGQVWDEDFVGMRTHAVADKDLASFWTSPEGIALAATTASYEARYHEVIVRGVRALLWHDDSKPGAGPADGRAFLRPNYLRVGVYDPATKRFVATAPRLAHTIRVFAPPDVGYAIVITGEVNAMLGGDLDPGQSLEAVYAFPFDASGRELGHLDLGHVGASSADLSLADDQLELDVRSPVPLPGGNSDAYAAQYKLVFGQPAARKVVTGPSQAPTGYDVFKTHIDAGYNHWGPTMFASDARYRYRATRTERTLTLPTGETVPIPAKVAHGQGTPRMLPDPSGAHVLLLWNAEQTECNHTEIPGRFQLALVTRTGSVVTAMGAGKGAAAGAFDSAGHLFVQRDRRVVQVDLRDFSETPLPDGVLLTPPNVDDPQCGF
jgi:hypothetical protein